MSLQHFPTSASNHIEGLSFYHASMLSWSQWPTARLIATRFSCYALQYSTTNDPRIFPLRLRSMSMKACIGLGKIDKEPLDIKVLLATPLAAPTQNKYLFVNNAARTATCNSL